jgi:hypothetical protein
MNTLPKELLLGVSMLENHAKKTSNSFVNTAPQESLR